MSIVDQKYQDVILARKMVEHLASLPEEFRYLAVSYQLAVLEPEQQLRVIKTFGSINPKLRDDFRKEKL